MINIREGILRCNLKPRVESDLPGRLRMIFPRYALLPDSAMPYIHFFGNSGSFDIFSMGISL